MNKQEYKIVTELLDDHRGFFLALGEHKKEMGRIRMLAHESNDNGVTLSVLKTVFPSVNRDYRGMGIGNQLLLTGVRWAKTKGRTYLTGLYAPEIPWDEKDEEWLLNRGISMSDGGEIYGIVSIIVSRCIMLQKS